MMTFNATERLQELFYLAGLGDFSATKYLFALLILAVMVPSLVWMTAILRGACRSIANAAVRDVMIGMLLVVGVFTLPAAIYFVGRGCITALTGKESEGTA